MTRRRAPSGVWQAPPELLYACALLGMLGVLFLLYPIRYIDSDLWIHLSDGRYFFDHHAIPNDSYFSFLDPPRASPNFRWLFQVLVYRLFTWGGYQALIVLRAGLYLLSAAAILGLLWKGQRGRAARLWARARAGRACGRGARRDARPRTPSRGDRAPLR